MCADFPWQSIERTGIKNHYACRLKFNFLPCKQGLVHVGILASCSVCPCRTRVQQHWAFLSSCTYNCYRKLFAMLLFCLAQMQGARCFSALFVEVYCFIFSLNWLKVIFILLGANAARFLSKCHVLVIFIPPTIYIIYSATTLPSEMIDNNLCITCSHGESIILPNRPFSYVHGSLHAR